MILQTQHSEVQFLQLWQCTCVYVRVRTCVYVCDSVPCTCTYHVCGLWMKREKGDSRVRVTLGLGVGVRLRESTNTNMSHCQVTLCPLKRETIKRQIYLRASITDRCLHNWFSCQDSRSCPQFRNKKHVVPVCLAATSRRKEK